MLKQRRLKFLASWRSQRVLISYFTLISKNTTPAKYHAQHSAITPLSPKMQSLASTAWPNLISFVLSSNCKPLTPARTVYHHQYAGQSLWIPTSSTFTPQPLDLGDSIPESVWYASTIFHIAGRLNLLSHQTVRINPVFWFSKFSFNCL